MSISMTDARTLYVAYIQGQIQRMAPAMRNNPVYVTVDPRTGTSIAFSWPDLLTEVQRGTAIGNNEAVKYARQVGYVVT